MDINTKIQLTETRIARLQRDNRDDRQVLFSMGFTSAEQAKGNEEAEAILMGIDGRKTVITELDAELTRMIELLDK